MSTAIIEREVSLEAARLPLCWHCNGSGELQLYVSLGPEFDHDNMFRGWLMITCLVCYGSGETNSAPICTVCNATWSRPLYVMDDPPWQTLSLMVRLPDGRVVCDDCAPADESFRRTLALSIV